MVKRVCFLVIIFLFLGKDLAIAAPWIIESRFTPPFIARLDSKAITFDQTGYPHLVYEDEHLYYLYSEGNIWHYEIIDPLAGQRSCLSIGLDAVQRAYVCFYDQEKVTYFTNSTGTWLSETVDYSSAVTWCSSLVCELNGTVHLCYFDHQHLKYAARINGLWQIEIVDDSGTSGWWASLALDHDSQAHMAYYDLVNKDLKYAVKVSGVWQHEPVDTFGSLGRSAFFQLDSLDQAHICYYDEENSYLKYSTGTLGLWQNEIVDKVGAADQSASLVIDTLGYVHIGYYSGSGADSKLKYATNAGGFWQTEVVDSSSEVGWFGHTALHTPQLMAIRYYDLTNKCFKSAMKDLFPQPGLLVLPKEHNFGRCIALTASSPFLINLSNTMSRELTIGNISLADPSNFSFNLQLGNPSIGNLPLTIEPGGERTLAVTFQPASIGLKQSCLTINSDDPNHPSQIVTLSGQGVHFYPEIENVAWQAEVNLVGGSFFTNEPGGIMVSEDTLIDGVFLPKGYPANWGTVWWDSQDGQNRSITLNLGEMYCLESYLVQADYNEVYFLYYWDTTYNSWRLIWKTLPIYGATGMQTRPDPLNEERPYYYPTMIVTNALMVRESKGTGDGLGAISEIQAYGSLASLKADVFPQSYDFGGIMVGSPSPPLELIIFNARGDKYEVGELSVSDPNNYTLNVLGGQNPCWINTPIFNSGQSKTCTITFNPDSGGNKTAFFTIASVDPNIPPTIVPLMGLGLVPVPEPEPEPELPDINTSFLHHHFGEIVVGNSSAPLVLTIFNTGNLDLYISEIILANAGSFSLDLLGGSNPCAALPLVISPGSSRTCTLYFHPSSEGTQTGGLTIKSNDPDTPNTIIFLEGSGLPPQVGNIQVTPLSHDFGGVEKGKTSYPVLLTITNTGNADLQVLGITPIPLANFYLDFQAGANPCHNLPMTIAPGTNRTLSITFCPGSIGSMITNMVIQSDDPDTPYTQINLFGQGLLPPPADLEVLALTYDFGTVLVGNTSDPIVINLHNKGGSQLQISKISLSENNNFFLDFRGGINPGGSSSFFLAPGNYRTCSVSFKPVSAGAKTTNLIISSDDPDQPSLNISFKGQGKTKSKQTSSPPVFKGFWPTGGYNFPTSSWYLNYIPQVNNFTNYYYWNYPLLNSWSSGAYNYHYLDYVNYYGSQINPYYVYTLSTNTPDWLIEYKYMY